MCNSYVNFMSLHNSLKGDQTHNYAKPVEVNGQVEWEVEKIVAHKVLKEGV